MNKNATLYIYTMLLMISGIILIAMVQSPYTIFINTFFITILLSGLFALVAAYNHRSYQVPLKYHALHAVGLLIYGIAVLTLTEDLNHFFFITVFYLLYYGLAELVFGLQMLLQKDKMLFRIIVVRLALGFSVGLVVVGLFISLDKYVNLTNSIKIIGALFIVTGINLFIFKEVLKKLYQKDHVLTKEDTVV